jgi:hypothetical protein
MFKLRTLAALGLLFGAIAAQAGPIKITALPYTIVAPGNYELTGNLSYTTPPPQSGQLPPFALPGGSAAIVVNVNSPGEVVVNLEGFSLYGGLSFGDGICVIAGNDVTIKNGTIGGVYQGFWYGIALSPTNGYLSNITVSNITFYGEREGGVILGQVNNSTVKDCTFINAIPGYSSAQFGISDGGSETGNIYDNDYFDGAQSQAIEVAGKGALVLQQARFVPKRQP